MQFEWNSCRQGSTTSSVSTSNFSWQTAQSLCGPASSTATSFFRSKPLKTSSGVGVASSLRLPGLLLRPSKHHLYEILDVVVRQVALGRELVWEEVYEHLPHESVRAWQHSINSILPRVCSMVTILVCGSWPAWSLPRKGRKSSGWLSRSMISTHSPPQCTPG